MKNFHYGDRLRLKLKDGKTVEGRVTTMGNVFQTCETPHDLRPCSIKTDKGEDIIIQKRMKICKLDQ